MNDISETTDCLAPCLHYLSVTDDMRYVNVSVHTALYKLHIVLCQSPRLVCEYILHLEKQTHMCNILLF